MQEGTGKELGEPLRIEASGAGRWTFLARIVAQVCQIVTFLLAARILGPAEFGLFALVQAFSVLLFAVSGAGWREVMVSTAETRHEMSQVLGFSLAFGIGVSLAGLAMAAGMHTLFRQTEAAVLLALFSACILVAPLGTSWSGQLMREGRARTLAGATMVSEVAGLAITAKFLLLDYGVYSLAFGKIAHQLTFAAIAAWKAGWHGEIRLRGPRTRHLMSTSMHVLANRLIGFLQTNGVTFIVGAFLGPIGVGFYRAAERVVASVAELVMEPIRMIAWVRLRQAADGSTDPTLLKERVAVEAAHLLPLFLIAAAPVFIGLGLVAEALIPIILGADWAPTGTVAAIFAFASLGAVPGTIAEPMLTLIGEVRRLPRIMLLNGLASLAIISLAGNFGLYVLAAASLVTSGLTLGVTFWLMRRYGSFSFRRALKDAAPILLPLVLMAGSVMAVNWIAEAQGLTDLAGLALQILAGAVAYLVVLNVTRPDMLRLIIRL